MADIKAPVVVRTYTDDELFNMSPAQYGTLRPEDLKRIGPILRARTTGIMPAKTYKVQAMDEMLDVLTDLINGNVKDVPEAYVKLSKADAVKLRDQILAVVTLGKSLITKGQVFDLRFDQRGFGWCKLTENWRKNGPVGKDGEPTNKMQDTFESYKDNDTVSLL